MKKFYVLIMGLLIIVTACKKDASNSPSGTAGCMDPNSLSYNPLATVDDGSCKYPTTQQRALVMEFTSTACHYCGMWGHDTFESMVANNPDKAIPVCVHRYLNTPGQDPMEVESTFLSSITKYWGFGAPQFYVDFKAITSYGQFNPSLLLATMNPANVGVATKSTIVGDTIIIKAFVKFFTNPAGGNWFGQYDINCFILESGIPGYNNGSYNQSTDPPNSRVDYKHDFTLRSALNKTKVFGNILMTGTSQNPILENHCYMKTFKVKLDPSWNHSNIRVSTTVWLDETTKFTFINGFLE